MPFDAVSFAMGANSSGGGGGSGLPPVTSDDNGDVLTVVEGAWAKAAPSGGGGVLVVHRGETTPITLDKTWQEIHDAAPLVVATGTNRTGAVIFEWLGEYASGEGSYAVLFGNDAYLATSADDYPELPL